MRARCLKCRMGFRVEEPDRYISSQDGDETKGFNRCPICYLRFWDRIPSNFPDGTRKPVIVGVLQEDITDNLVEDAA